MKYEWKEKGKRGREWWLPSVGCLREDPSLCTSLFLARFHGTAGENWISQKTRSTALKMIIEHRTVVYIDGVRHALQSTLSFCRFVSESSSQWNGPNNDNEGPGIKPELYDSITQRGIKFLCSYDHYSMRYAKKLKVEKVKFWKYSPSLDSCNFCYKRLQTLRSKHVIDSIQGFKNLNFLRAQLKSVTQTIENANFFFFA
jgi:hypothetical protein